jgi:hypothetical protein
MFITIFGYFLKYFQLKKLKLSYVAYHLINFLIKKIINLCMFIKIKNPCKKNKDKLYVWEKDKRRICYK